MVQIQIPALEATDYQKPGKYNTQSIISSSILFPQAFAPIHPLLGECLQSKLNL